MFWILIRNYFFEKNDTDERIDIDLGCHQLSDEEIKLRQYDLDLCGNKDEYENYLKDKYNLLSLDDYWAKRNNFDVKDNEIYYYLDAYDMVHNNELHTCVAAYKLEYALPRADTYIDWYRETRSSWYIVDSKNDSILWERTTQDYENSNFYDEEFWDEFDKYRDYFDEWQKLENDRLLSCESYSIATLLGVDSIEVINIDEIAKSLFDKSYNDYFTDEEKLEIQNKVNEDLWYWYTKYIVIDWPYSWWWIEFIDAVANGVQTIDLSNIELFTSEDYEYYDEFWIKKRVKYLNNYTNPDLSTCVDSQDPQHVVECPENMFPVSWSKVCIDLHVWKQIPCQLIKF